MNTYWISNLRTAAFILIFIFFEISSSFASNEDGFEVIDINNHISTEDNYKSKKRINFTSTTTNTYTSKVKVNPGVESETVADTKGWKDRNREKQLEKYEHNPYLEVFVQECIVIAIKEVLNKDFPWEKFVTFFKKIKLISDNECQSYNNFIKHENFFNEIRVLLNDSNLDGLAEESLSSHFDNLKFLIKWQIIISKWSKIIDHFNYSTNYLVKYHTRINSQITDLVTFKRELNHLLDLNIFKKYVTPKLRESIENKIIGVSHNLVKYCS